MTTPQRSLHELIKRGLYAPDERAVAAAIVARALAHATVARASFHSDPITGPMSIRSVFRRRRRRALYQA
jgi:hypothetical protein